MAQNHKETLVQQIEEESNWLDARVIETMATLNFSESMWEKVLSDQMYPKGLSTFGRMGGAFADLSDKFGDTYLNKKCGFGEAVDVDNRQYCSSIIEDLADRYSITVNAQNVQGSKDAFKMVLGYVSSFAIYLQDGSSSIWNHGYSPNSDELHIIINADNKYKEVTMSWSEDKSTVTLNAPADIETVNWDGKIHTGLKRGWSVK
ncbi:MAG: hypothetical protein R3E32_02985 [Chitinophagales bacterium]